MKKVFMAALFMLLVLPGVAQAYYFNVYNDINNNGLPSHTTHGDQMDVTLGAKDSTFTYASMQSVNASGAFTILPDAGEAGSGNVGVTVTAGLLTSFALLDWTFPAADVSYSITISDSTGTNLVDYSFSTRYQTTVTNGLFRETDYIDRLFEIGNEYTYSIMVTVGLIDPKDVQAVSANSLTSLDITSATPIPGAAWLLGSGLVGLLGLRRKMKA